MRISRRIASNCGGTLIARGAGMRRHSLPFLILAAALAACGGSTTSDATTSPAGEKTEQPAANASATPTDETLAPASFCTGGSVGYDSVGEAIFAALTPDSPVGYLALRQNVGGIPSPGLSKELRLVRERGQVCSGASDVAKCQKAYDAVSPEIRLGFQHCFTRGDAVGCVESVSEAIALLGHVSSLEEAYFVAEYAGYGVSCGTTAPSQGKQLADGSFRLSVSKTTAGGPCGKINRALVEVARDGSVRELSLEVVVENPSCP